MRDAGHVRRRVSADRQLGRDPHESDRARYEVEYGSREVLGGEPNGVGGGCHPGSAHGRCYRGVAGRPGGTAAVTRDPPRQRPGRAPSPARQRSRAR